ncbi:MAG TPA: VWA domain-containing protein [Natronosporangium sp.]|nr:VWA domain-containing protein [Natronosporangium sp.]
MADPARAGRAGGVPAGAAGPPAGGGVALADLATVAARFGAALRERGLPVGPERCQRFAAAAQATAAATTEALYHCALATLVSDPEHVAELRRVFQLVFGGAADPAGGRGQAGDRPSAPPPTAPRTRPRPGTPARTAGVQPLVADRADGGDEPPRQVPHPAFATAAERLASRDFAELTDSELAELVAAMRRLRLALPLRPSRRTTAGPRGRVDLRASLRQARRTGGHPVRLRRRWPRQRPRRLVVLCDISGSMAPYARALLQLLYCAAGGAEAEVFTFATRLTRLTRTLARVSPAAALERAGRAAPDWSGGTRIGESLKRFIDSYGARGMARQAVVLIVSDGWDTGDPAVVGRQMSRLSRLAYRIVWANPRSATPGFQPLAGGMAAAWPYCDTVVSAHRLDALGDLLDAIAGRAGSPRTGGGTR